MPDDGCRRGVAAMGTPRFPNLYGEAVRAALEGGVVISAGRSAGQGGWGDAAVVGVVIDAGRSSVG